MKITKLETMHVKPRWLFLKVHTDEGIVGWGEPIVKGRAQTVEAAVHEIGRYLVGRDPRRIEHHWQAIYRGQFYRGGPVLCSALSGIEQALWDILGKWLDVPVYQLLGGHTRDKIRVYGWLHGESYGDYIESAKVGLDAGLTAFKFGLIGSDEYHRFTRSSSIRTSAVLRPSVRQFGLEIEVGIDFHGRVSPAMAIQLAKALEPYQPMFIEEPVLPENVDELVRVARGTSIPIATGERFSPNGVSAKSWKRVPQ